MLIPGTISFFKSTWCFVSFEIAFHIYAIHIKDGKTNFQNLM